LHLGRLLGHARLHEGLAGLRPQFGAQAGTVLAHVARDRLELRGRLGVAAGAEHGGGHAMPGGEPTALGVPFLRRRQGLERLGARQVHALVVLAQMVGRLLEYAQALRGARRGRQQGETGHQTGKQHP
jgi:hypothetical protein